MGGSVHRAYVRNTSDLFVLVLVLLFHRKVIQFQFAKQLSSIVRFLRDDDTLLFWIAAPSVSWFFCSKVQMRKVGLTIVYRTALCPEYVMLLACSSITSLLFVELQVVSGKKRDWDLYR